MRIVVLGGRGAWPSAEQACSGFLVEHRDFRLLIDPGYATLQPLLTRLPAAARRSYGGPVAVARSGVVLDLPA
jgi:ribonuclease BN (tRNA processing enzyme)